MKTYPRTTATPNASWIRMGPGKGPKCCVCVQKATHSALVEVDIYRGDDLGAFKACEEHSGDAYALLDTMEEKVSA